MVNPNPIDNSELEKTEPLSTEPRKSSPKNRRSVSKRVISEKIEEIFHTVPRQQKSYKDNFKYFWMTQMRYHPKRNLLLSLVFLGMVMVFGWVYVYSEFFRYQPVEQISFNSKVSYEAYGSIISTPVLSDVNFDQQIDVVFADVLGNVFAFDYKGGLIYRFSMGEGVIASLMEIDIDGYKPNEILVVNEAGEFFVLNQQGDYLYRSRSEVFQQKVFAKPAYIKEDGMLFLAGRQGTIWGLNASYGEVVWQNNQSPLKERKVFSSPMVLRSESESTLVDSESQDLILVLSEDGNLVALRKDNGFLVWYLALDDQFKSSMTLGNFLNEVEGQQIVLTSLSGKIYLISDDGKLLKRLLVNQPIISTGTKGWVAPEKLGLVGNKQALIVVTETGTVLGIRFTENSDSKAEKIFQFKGEKFISSPLVADFTQDGIDDILIVARSGKVYLIDGEKNTLLNPAYQLNYQVSASPLVADMNGDGELELVIAGENGELTILGLEYFPKRPFPEFEILQSEFLVNSLNQN